MDDLTHMAAAEVERLVGEARAIDDASPQVIFSAGLEDESAGLVDVLRWVFELEGFAGATSLVSRCRPITLALRPIITAGPTGANWSAWVPWAADPKAGDRARGAGVLGTLCGMELAQVREIDAGDFPDREFFVLDGARHVIGRIVAM